MSWVKLTYNSRAKCNALSYHPQHKRQTYSPTILCCSETWLRDDSLLPIFSGYKGFHSRLLPRSHPSTKFLPGSSLFVSSDLQPQQTDVCRSVAKDCSVLNVCCCLITCKVHQIACLYIAHRQYVLSQLLRTFVWCCRDCYLM